jgi:transmembrane sensor
MERAKFLLTKYLDNQASEEEVREILQWLRNNEHNELLLQQVWEQQERAAPAANLRNMWMAIESATQPPVRKMYAWRWWAAAVLLFVVCGLWFVVDRRNAKQPAVTQIPGIKDVAPGKDGAILTLADGRQVVLDSLGNGIVANQNGTQAVLKNGQLEYKPLTIDDSRLTNDHSSSFNTISTPRGRQFQLVLPDGSKVWLNAASSLRYPTVFAGNERRVEVTGEAYFEIEKNPNKPFRVTILPSSGGAGGGRKAEVEVLGTHFNINAYDDEDVIRTTLLEGKVRVVNRQSAIGSQQSVTLKPGAQARIAISAQSHQSSPILVQTVDTEQVMAWKNGFFQFNRTPLSEVLKQLARWYDVEIVYEQGVPDIRLGGEMKRDLTLAQVLKGLGKIGVNFRIEGKTLVVVSK